MAASVVQICNLALGHTGSKSVIEDLDEKSPQAKICKQFYDPARMQVLEAYDWDFARRRRALALHNDAPPAGIWTWRYQYPADCLKFREIENPSREFATDAIPFKVEASVDGESMSILTDMDRATGIYTFDQKVAAMFSWTFVQAFSLYLGGLICPQLTGQKDRTDYLIKRANDVIVTAATLNANENVDSKPRDTAWIRYRNG